jgi:putative ABC transport system permease protein
MNLFKLAYSNIVQKPFNAALTVIMLTMGVALAAVLIMGGKSLNDGFKNNIGGIDMVVGAKGSPLQLILSAIYQIDDPTGNIPLSEAQALSKHPLVKETIFLSYGDSYKGRRIIGTTKSYPELYNAQLQSGTYWEIPFEVVLGADVATESGLKVGDEFYSAHGMDENAEVHEDHPFKVVGVLKPSQSVLDKLILTSQESIWDVHGSHGSEEEEKEITAMLVKFKSKMGIIGLPRYVNGKTSMQAALPAIEVNRLFELFASGLTTLRIIAFSVLVLGALSVFVSMISSLKDRSFEMALIRTMGASRSQVFLMIILEALILGIIGGVLGMLLARIGLIFINSYTAAELGTDIAFWTITGGELLLFGATIALCLIAAAIPAWQTINKDVSNVLSKYAD